MLSRLISAALIASLSLSPIMSAAQSTALPDYVVEKFGTPPDIPSGPLPEPLQRAVNTLFIDGIGDSGWDRDKQSALYEITQSGDPRLAWIITDRMRFTWQAHVDDALANSASQLLGITLQTPARWAELTDHLIAWDVPAYPGYLKGKRAIFTQFVPGWERIFVEGDIDWRLVSWGGVNIDDRLYDTTDEVCHCIPAADNPPVTSAEEATWLKDDDIVFGIEINGEARAYPRRIMEVREMVNDTLGGRDLGIPYCTLCGAAQAYFTDDVPTGVKRPILRTSGLLIRSNKVMYDRETWSVFDTFLGHAVTGPLAEKGVKLKQATVITSDWGSWKAAYPHTTVLKEYLALGRDFDFRSGRDAKGPIFPVGDVDPRLGVQDDVIGVTSPAGNPIAFPRTTALVALQQGAEVALNGVKLQLDAGGIRATASDGTALPSHEAFWFAWSQFHPGTALWAP